MEATQTVLEILKFWLNQIYLYIIQYYVWSAVSEQNR